MAGEELLQERSQAEDNWLALHYNSKWTKQKPENSKVLPLGTDTSSQLTSVENQTFHFSSQSTFIGDYWNVKIVRQLLSF